MHFLMPSLSALLSSFIVIVFFHGMLGPFADSAGHRVSGLQWEMGLGLGPFLQFGDGRAGLLMARLASSFGGRAWVSHCFLGSSFRHNLSFL